MKNPALAHAVVASLLALVLLGAYAFSLREMALLEERAFSLSAEIEKKTKEYSQASVTRDALAEVAAEEGEIQRHFVPTENIVEFLEGVEALGAEFGATVTVVSVTDPTPEGKITLAVSITGSFDAVMRTLGRVEYSQYASATHTLTLDTAEGGLWTAAVTVTVLAPKTP